MTHIIKGITQYIENVNQTSTKSSTDVIMTGMTLPIPVGKYLVNFNSQYKILSGNITGQAAIDYTNAYNILMSFIPTNTTHLPAFGGSETLTPGVYTISAAGSLAGNLTLDAQGNSNAVFIFRFGAAFSTAAASNIILTNGASASNIYWVCEGAMSLGAMTTIKGSLFAHNGAVNLGASCNVYGRLLTNVGAIGIDGSTISKTSSSSVNIGTLLGFAMFTSLGNVTNSGVSTITGDIGTNSGTISGFGSAVVNGNTYLPGVDNNAKATFSIYINETKISNSEKTRELISSTIDVHLNAVIIITSKSTLYIKYKVDAGEVIVNNRLLTINEVNIR